jgi:hypothetical protein
MIINMSTVRYTLYKKPIQLETLEIVQYLNSVGIICVPETIYECNYPHYVTELPSILYKNTLFSGMASVIDFYEQVSEIQNLKELSSKFKIDNPEYRIHK